MHCGQHYAYLTVRTIEDDGRALTCLRCQPLDGKPSQHERTAYEYIEALQKCHEYNNILWVCEARIVKNKAPVDVYFVQEKLVLQIDGEAHFKGKLYNTLATAQARIDARFDDACWNQGFKLVRVHFKDLHTLDSLLAQAIDLCRQQPVARFALYSDTWPSGNRYEK